MMRCQSESCALQDLCDPVHQFHVGVAPQLAEHRGAFDGLVGQAVELAEQGDAVDFSHDVPFESERASCANERQADGGLAKRASSATRERFFMPSQDVQPSRP